MRNPKPLWIIRVAEDGYLVGYDQFPNGDLSTEFADCHRKGGLFTTQQVQEVAEYYHSFTDRTVTAMLSTNVFKVWRPFEPSELSA